MSDFKYERSGEGLSIGEDVRGTLIIIRSWYDSANRQNARPIAIPANERRDAAQALAGDEWRVVPADEHERLQATLDGANARIEKLREHRDELRQRISDQAHARLYEAHAAQPDRPEPVSPASVRVGDIVDYETTVEYRLCRIMGEVEDVAEHVTGEDGWSLKIHDKWWNCNIATVSILQRPEPELDEAAVEALADALVGVGVTSAGPDALGYARALIRHRGVSVEVSE